MKYTVQLTKVITRVVVIDAQSEEEADKKMLANDVEKSWEYKISRDDYGDWEYVGSRTDEADQLLTSADDIAKLYGYEDSSGLERALYKNTECGMCAEWDDNKITLVGYVEGADCDGPSETLAFPFSIAKYREVVEDLEERAEEMWHEWNGEEV